MTVPSREEAARLLLSLEPPAWHLRHSRAVAEIASWLALRAGTAGGDLRAPGAGHPRGHVAVRAGAARGGSVDRGLVEAAALLHDVDKLLPGERRPTGSHGEAGGRWLAARGHPEVVEAVELHPVTLLADSAGASRVLGASVEARIVAYADKRAGQRLEAMADRFDRWRRRHPHGRSGDGWSASVAEIAWRHARELEVAICELVGVRPEDVRRIPWTGRALSAGRTAHWAAGGTGAAPAPAGGLR